MLRKEVTPNETSSVPYDTMRAPPTYDNCGAANAPVSTMVANNGGSTDEKTPGGMPPDYSVQFNSNPFNFSDEHPPRNPYVQQTSE